MYSCIFLGYYSVYYCKSYCTVNICFCIIIYFTGYIHVHNLFRIFSGYFKYRLVYDYIIIYFTGYVHVHNLFRIFSGYFKYRLVYDYIIIYFTGDKHIESSLYLVVMPLW